jgi:hypothetical protein
MATINEFELNLNQTPRLKYSDKRLLLGASLRLLLRRFNSGQPVFRTDLIRLASLGDVKNGAESEHG